MGATASVPHNQGRADGSAARSVPAPEPAAAASPTRGPAVELHTVIAEPLQVNVGAVTDGVRAHEVPNAADVAVWDHQTIDGLEGPALKGALKQLQLQYFKLHREAYELRCRMQELPSPDPSPLKKASSFKSATSELGDGPQRRASGAASMSSSLVSSKQRSFTNGGYEAVGEEATALCHCASRGDVEQLRELLNRGVSPDVADYDKRTPLHTAAEEGHLFTVQLLLDFGANVNPRDRWGHTPLWGALSNVHNDVANLLKDHGATAVVSPQDARQGGAQRRQDRLHQSHVYSLEKFCNLPSGSPIPINGLACYYYSKYGVDATSCSVVFAELVAFTEPPLADELVRLQDWHTEEPPHHLSPEVKTYYQHVTRHLRASGDQERAMRGGGITLKDSSGAASPGRGAGFPYARTTLARLSLGTTAIGNWGSFVKCVHELCQSVAAGADDGACNPLFADKDDHGFSVSLCTVEGQTFTYGDDAPFALHSCAKVLSYAAAIDLHGERYIHDLVGRDSSGKAYDDVGSAVSDATKKPYNAATNAGGLVVLSTYHPNLPVNDRLERLRVKLSEAVGNSDVHFDEGMFRAESASAYQIRAIAHLLSARNCYPDHVKTHEDLNKLVEIYLRSCSLACTGSQLSRLAATFANFGTCPTTGTKCFSWDAVRCTLSLCFGCGLWEVSGTWAATVGMPAISSISGGLLIVVPGVLGIAVRSPKLDGAHNSVRGQIFAQRFAEKFKWSVMDLAYRANDMTAMAP
eukprot:TRINITY_DN2112_c1_g1_i1.p1 TRINITY_DN2112_c1_g1~~TRINITY_DN2112_c1_g1_i1.p1  ORF type:complete len:750 (+),score=123.41 TRINITY_DN2112_c1_g1_i1:662-2911(+)